MTPQGLLRGPSAQRGACGSRISYATLDIPDRCLLQTEAHKILVSEMYLWAERYLRAGFQQSSPRTVALPTHLCWRPSNLHPAPAEPRLPAMICGRSVGWFRYYSPSKAGTTLGTT